MSICRVVLWWGLVAVLVPTAALGQTEHLPRSPYRFEVSGGISSPWKPDGFNKLWNPGISAGVGFSVEGSEVALVLLVDLQTFVLDAADNIKGGRLTF